MDLGLGFDQAAIGMALVGLDGRFLRVNRGGQLEISSQPYQGTQVVLRLPE
jgi:signal transduction histidine kinase